MNFGQICPAVQTDCGESKDGRNPFKETQLLTLKISPYLLTIQVF
jgi:hypothetical protein